MLDGSLRPFAENVAATRDAVRVAHTVGILAIFIVQPTYQTWIERLKKRYKTEADFQAEWPKRRQSSIEELKHALEVPYYHVIINDDLDDAVQICHEIIERGDIFSSRDDHARLAARSLLDELEKIH